MPATGSGDGGDGDSKAKPTYSTRVFKKAAPNNKITAYLGRRDFFDTGDKVDVVDGVVLVDREYMNRETGWKVFVHLMAAFRYGREDLESSAGLIYKKDIYSKYFQVYPPLEENKKITRLQDRLIKKLGDSAYPFLFELPRHLAASISILPAPNENGKPSGVDYQLTAFVGFGSDDRVDKKNSVRMAIKKLNLLSDNHRKQPSVDLKKDFVLSNYPVCIEARLDKELYIHGEEIKLHLNIDNRSSKTLKTLVIEVKQYAEVTVGGITASYKSIVAQIDSEVGFPINPSSHMSQTYSVTPSMDCNTRQETKRGCALDGQFKVGESNLAASSAMGECPTPEMREAQAIVIQYKLKARLTVVRGTDIKFDLPFRLAHNRPTEPVFVRKSGNDGATPQYVSVNQTEAANLMSTMSEYTSLKKPAAGASGSSTNVSSGGDVYAQPKKNAEKKASAGGRISAPPANAQAAAAKRPTAQATASQPQQQQQQPPAQQQPAVADDLIDLMMFDPTKSASGDAKTYSNVTLDPLLGGQGAAPAQSMAPQAARVAQQMPQQMPQQNFMQQPQQQPFGQPQQQPFMAQQQPFGQPAAQPYMQQSVNPFGAQQQPQQQMFMPMQQQQPAAGMFGGMPAQQQPQQMAASNPFAVAQPAQQHAFMAQQQQPFMGMAQPQQQAQQFAGFGAFGNGPNAMQPQQAAAPAATNDDDFFEEFVNMRMDGSEA